jgi:hypothetical protein
MTRHGFKLAIVGAEEAKFTRRGRERAKELIRNLYLRYNPTIVVSGACHLGGVDIWARDEFVPRKGEKFKEFPPEKRSWPYYKARNIQIAEYAERVICITVDKLPRGYKGMRFKLCYHCGTSDHVKSGGCWTAKYARKLGKPAETIVIKNYKERK